MNLKINGSKFMTMYLQPEEREQQHMCLLVFQTNLQTQKKSSCILNLTQLIMIFNDFTAACISQKFRKDIHTCWGTITDHHVSCTDSPISHIQQE